jgi:four helix bundle protein
MATIEKFEDLKIWQMARNIYNKIRPIVLKLRENHEYRYAEQMRSSSGSVMDNIAEGFDKNSRLEFINSLGIATSEAGELGSQLYRCLDDKYISEAEFQELKSDLQRLTGKISILISYLNTCEQKGLKFKNRKK